MNFLKKHYEKIVLLALFIIFALLLVHLYSIIQSTGEVKESDLQIPTRDPDYVVTKMTDKKFDLPKIFSEKNTWQKSASRAVEPSKDFSDVMTVFKIVRCGHCKYLIPRRIMEEQLKCPRCRKELLKPKAEAAGAQLAARLDSDEDGIPNVFELENKLDPYNADDALFDLDDDGFSNLYEFQKGTKLDDAKSHPELCDGLYLVDIERQPLKAKLLGVTIIEGRDKQMWSIQMETEEQVVLRRKRPLEKHYLAIGNRIRLDTGIYTVSDIKVEKVTRVNEKKKKEEVNSGYIILKDRKNREITMKVGEVAYDPDDKAIFKDVWTGKSYVAKVGTRFRMGNATVGYSRYLVKSIRKRGSIANSHVVLTPAAKGAKDVTIKSTPIIPRDAMPVKENDKDKNDGKSAEGAADNAAAAK